MTYQEQQDAIKNKATELGDRASGFMDKAGRQANDAKKQAVDTLHDYGVDTDTLGKALTSSADSIGKSLRSLVRDRPLGALAVTAAVGLIIGAMTSR